MIAFNEGKVLGNLRRVNGILGRQKAEGRSQIADCRLQILDFKNQRLDAELLSNDGDQFTVETPREERARALGGMPFTMSLLRILTSAF